MRAHPDAYVERSSRLRWRVVCAVLGLGPAVAMFFSVLSDPRNGDGARFGSLGPAVIGAVGALIVIGGPVAAAYYFAFSDTDADGVRFAVDRDGIYLARVMSGPVPWTQVAEVITFDYFDGRGETAGWTSAVTVRLIDNPHHANPDTEPNPARWGPCRDMVLRDEARDAITRLAPQVPVRDLGRILESEHW